VNFRSGTDSHIATHLVVLLQLLVILVGVTVSK